MQANVSDDLPRVYATMNYLKAPAEKPRIYTFEPPADVPQSTGEIDAVPNLPIFDARPLADALSLDREGFVLRRHRTAVTDFSDARQIADIYYAEVERLLVEATGAAKVVVFDHTFRSGRSLREAVKGFRDPVRRVHNDYTEASAPQRVRDLLPQAEAEARLKRRFAELNVWRPIQDGPVREFPLAVCDARTLEAEDFIATDLFYRDRVGEIYNVRFSPRHRWYYFPHMERDEVLIIKCFDSATDGRARFSAHAAFDDPTTPPDAVARESIEARALAFF